MTLAGFDLTFQMFQEETAITERLPVESFELEWEAEISGMEPPLAVQQMRFGDLHFTFPEVNELIETAIHHVSPNVAVPINPRPTIKVGLGTGHSVEYHDTTLVSMSYSAHEDEPVRLEATWRFRDASVPRITVTRHPRQLPPMQKLDWKQLGF
jgi:hypothetical protein